MHTVQISGPIYLVMLSDYGYWSQSITPYSYLLPFLVPTCVHMYEILLDIILLSSKLKRKQGGDAQTVLISKVATMFNFT